MTILTSLHRVVLCIPESLKHRNSQVLTFITMLISFEMKEELYKIHKVMFEAVVRKNYKEFSFFHLLSFNSSWKNLFTSLQLVKRVCQEVTKYFPEFYGYSQKGFSTFTITYFIKSLNWKWHKNVETIAHSGTFM